MQYRELYKIEVSGAYLFYGKEKLLMDNTVEYLINKYTNPEMRTFNLAFLEGRQLTEENLISFCETLPVMNDKRLIFVKDVSGFSENLSKGFYKFLDELADFCILIFLDSDNNLNKVKSFYKYFSKKKRNIEFGKLNNRDVFNFVAGYLKRKGISISKPDLSYLVSKSSYNSKNVDITLYELKNELDKFISLSKDKFLDRNIIDSLIVESVDSNIFNFLDALSNKNTEKALLEYKNLYLMNEPVQKILFMFIRQVRNLISYKELKMAMYRENEIMNEIGVKSYEYGKIEKNARNFEINFLYEFYKKLLVVDEMLKTSSTADDVLLEMLIVEFTKK